MLRADFTPDGPQLDPTNNFFDGGQPLQSVHTQNQFSMPMMSNISPSHPGATGLRYFTIQRVNGNGGNGKGDGVAGPHKHSLDESDRVKKNTVQRAMMKKDKDEKKTQVRPLYLLPLSARSSNGCKSSLGPVQHSGTCVDPLCCPCLRTA